MKYWRVYVSGTVSFQGHVIVPAATGAEALEKAGSVNPAAIDIDIVGHEPLQWEPGDEAVAVATKDDNR